MHANGPAATYLFVTFCRLAGIDSCKQVRLLKKTLEIWSKRTSVIEASSVIRRMQEEIRKARETEQHRKERLDELRRDRNTLIRERDELLGRMESDQDPEQEQIVSSISPTKSLAIKGGAGTGKSLVLIECLRRARVQGELASEIENFLFAEGMTGEESN